MADRSRMPSATTDAPFAFPTINKSQLPNGLAVWSVRHGAVPVVTMVLMVRAGSSADPAARPGLASLTGDMLDEGAGTRDALEVHEALARIGAQFDTEVGPDATFLTLTTLTKFRPDGLALLSDLVVRPRFDPGEFERVRQLRTNRLRQLRDVPSATADRAFATAIYGDHPYGHLAIGTMAALEHMTLDDVRGFHRRAYQPAHAVLIVVGDLSHDRAVAEAAVAFGGWAAEPAAGDLVAPDIDAPGPAAHRLLLVDRAGAAQSELRHRPRRRVAPHARLPRAGRRQPRARRAVREPAEHEPARAEGLHLRRAVVVRVPAGAGPVPAVGQRADGGDGRRHRRGRGRSDVRSAAGGPSRRRSWRRPGRR